MNDYHIIGVGQSLVSEKINPSPMASKGQSCDVTTHVIRTAVIGNVGLETKPL